MLFQIFFSFRLVVGEAGGGGGGGEVGELGLCLPRCV